MNRKTIGVAVLLLIGLGVFFWLRGDEAPRAVRQESEAGPKQLSPAPKRMQSDHRNQASLQPPRTRMDADPEGTLRLEGQVLDATAAPVGRATVTVSSNPPRTATSEEDGSFFFDKLVGRTYALTAQKGDLAGGPVVHKLSATSDPAVIRVRIGAVVEVLVVEQDSKPVGQAQVVLSGDTTRSETADGSGKVQFRGVPSGGFILSAEASGFAPSKQLLMVADTTGISMQAQIVLRRGAAISGTVIDGDGKPVADARVLPLDQSELSAFGENRDEGVATDAKGKFTISAVAPGTYRVSARHPAYVTALSDSYVADGVTAISDVRIVIERGASIAGRVVTPAGQPAAWATVRVAPKEHTFVGAEVGVRQATANEAGEFTIKGLARIRLNATAATDTASSEIVLVDLTQIDRRTDVQLVLSVVGKIKGIVVDGKGDPVSEAQVTVEPDYWAQDGNTDELFVRGSKSDTTDGGGNFEFAGCQPGRIESVPLEARYP